MEELNQNLSLPTPVDKIEERRELKRKYEKERRDRILHLFQEIKTIVNKDNQIDFIARDEILKKAKQYILKLKQRKQYLNNQINL